MNFFLEIIFGENIFFKNIFWEDNFTFPPKPTPYYPPPTLNTAPALTYLLFEVGGGRNETKNEITDRTEHTMIDPFIYIDYGEYSYHK